MWTASFLHYLWWPCVLMTSLCGGALLPGPNPAAATPPPAAEVIENSPLLDSLLRSDSLLAPVIRRAAEYEVQIIYTQINRDAQNQPHFTPHFFNLDARRYFNPASMVKLPTVALALEKLNQLHQPGLTRRSPVATGVAYRCQTAAPYRPTADSDRVNTIGNYAKRMLLVSDNNAYNRLYEFLGQGPLNQRLWQLGYPNVRVTRRFAPCDTAANRHTNPIDFYDAATGQLIYQQPAAVNPHSFSNPLGRVTKGRAYRAGSRLVRAPYDFTTANYLPLQDVTTMLRTLLFPESVPPAQRFALTAADYAFLRRYLSSTPHGSGYRPYAAPAYFDAYKKYLYYGRHPDSLAHPNLRIYNIVGMSHGYLADVAYFADSARQAEFMLSAVVYVNKNGILNDGTYEYQTIGLPFLAEVGQLIYRYERTRSHQFLPDLSAFFADGLGQ